MRQYVLIVLCLVLAGCAANASNTQYAAADLAGAAPTVEGVVVSKRLVQVEGTSGVGGLAGTAAGAIAGHTIGGNSHVNLLGAVGGAVAGGLAGAAIERKLSQQQAFEYVVQVSKRKLVTIIQSDVQFNVGEKVFVILSSKPRIVKRGA